MTIRVLLPSDIDSLKKIHEKFYKNEFSFPDFSSPHFLCAFVVLDEDSQIVSVCGLRTIIEAIAITDKDRDYRERIEALNRVLTVSKYMVERAGYSEIHAFVQEEGWEHWMKHAGFSDTIGNSLVIGVK